MRKIIFCLLVIGAVAGVWSYTQRRAQDELIKNRNQIARDCEKALPMLERRYRNLGALLEECEKNANWQIPCPAPPPIHEDDNGQIVEYRQKGDYVLYPENGTPWDLKEALTHFKDAATPYQKAMAAVAIEDSAKAVLQEVTGPETVETNIYFVEPVKLKIADALTKPFQDDLDATDAATTEFLQDLVQNIDRYNVELKSSQVWHDSYFSPIGRDSVVVFNDSRNQ